MTSCLSPKVDQVKLRFLMPKFRVTHHAAWCDQATQEGTKGVGMMWDSQQWDAPSALSAAASCYPSSAGGELNAGVSLQCYGNYNIDTLSLITCDTAQSIITKDQGFHSGIPVHSLSQ